MSVDAEPVLCSEKIYIFFYLPLASREFLTGQHPIILSAAINESSIES